MDDYLFKVFVVNSQEYDNGNKETSGAWLSFPADTETVTKLFNELNLPNNAGTNLYFIDDSRADNSRICDIITRDSDIDELNYLANRIMQLDASERIVFEAVLEAEECRTVKNAINLTYNTECYNVIPDMDSWTDVGGYFLRQNIDLSPDGLDIMADYFDFIEYGRDYANETGGVLLEGVYLETGCADYKEMYRGNINDIDLRYIVTGHGRECHSNSLYEDKLRDSTELAEEIDSYMRYVSPSYVEKYPDAEKQKAHITDCLMDFVTVQLKDMIMETNTAEGSRLIDSINELEIEYPDDIYMLFQVKNGPETRDYRFSSTEELKKMGLTVDIKNYDLKYTKLLGDTMLENIYKKFNSGKVPDFDGRSMSVSDVIVFCTGTADTAYYCDPFGFTQLPGFLWEHENNLETAEKSTEQNYNMIDERINNEPGEKENNITVLVVEPLQEPYIKEIPNTLEALQKEVGGPIQAGYPFAEEAAIVCNDEANLEGMRLNRALYDAEGEIYDIVAGTFIVVGLGEDNFASLPPELMSKIQEQFKQPEMFVKVNGEIQAIPVKPSIKAKLEQLQKEKRGDNPPQKEPPKHEL